MSWRLVLVHLGDSSPPHLESNLSYLGWRFPDLKPVLIVDSQKLAQELAKKGFNVELFLYSRASNNFDWSKLGSDLRFRNGFWRYSTERIFALAEWHEANNQVSLIHIESDILLLENFPFDEIATLDKLQWQTVTLDHDVAAVLYSPSSAQTTWLWQAMADLLEQDSSLNDMTLLSRVRRNNPGLVGTLPSWSEEWGVPKLSDGQEVRRLTKPVTSRAPGVIDGSTIGVWLTGQDLRNNQGRMIVHRDFPNSVTESSRLDFHMKSGKLFASRNGGKSVPIYCLHIHSKNVSLFRDRQDRVLRRFVELSSDKSVKVVGFSWLAFYLWLRPLLPEFFIFGNYARFIRRKLSKK